MTILDSNEELLPFKFLQVHGSNLIIIEIPLFFQTEGSHIHLGPTGKKNIFLNPKSDKKLMLWCNLYF